MLKFLIIVAAALTLVYYTYWAATGVYLDVPFVDFL